MENPEKNSKSGSPHGSDGEGGQQEGISMDIKIEEKMKKMFPY